MDRYAVGHEVGRGARAVCYFVRDPTTSKKYVMKKVALGHLDEDAFRQTLDEPKLQQRFCDSNIVAHVESFLRVEEIGLDIPLPPGRHDPRHIRDMIGGRESSLCIILELGDQGDLSEEINRRICLCQERSTAYLSEAQVMFVFLQLLKGLLKIHAQGIVHRDVKTHNVFLCRDGTAKIGDFGVARELNALGTATEAPNHGGIRLDEPFERAGTLESMATTVVGSPYYMSPEVLATQPYDTQSDMWSLGCVLFELCALRRCFSGATLPQIAASIASTCPAKLCNELLPPGKYSLELTEVIESLLAFDAGLRPTAKQLLLKPFVRKWVSSLAKSFGHRFSFLVELSDLSGAGMLTTTLPQGDSEIENFRVPWQDVVTSCWCSSEQCVQGSGVPPSVFGSRVLFTQGTEATAKDEITALNQALLPKACGSVSSYGGMMSMAATSSRPSSAGGFVSLASRPSTAEDPTAVGCRCDMSVGSDVSSVDDLLIDTDRNMPSVGENASVAASPVVQWATPLRSDGRRLLKMQSIATDCGGCSAKRTADDGFPRVETFKGCVRETSAEGNTEFRKGSDTFDDYDDHQATMEVKGFDERSDMMASDATTLAFGFDGCTTTVGASTHDAADDIDMLSTAEDLGRFNNIRRKSLLQMATEEAETEFENHENEVWSREATAALLGSMTNYEDEMQLQWMRQVFTNQIRTCLALSKLDKHQWYEDDDESMASSSATISRQNTEGILERADSEQSTVRPVNCFEGILACLPRSPTAYGRSGLPVKGGAHKMLNSRIPKPSFRRQIEGKFKQLKDANLGNVRRRQDERIC